MRDAINLNSFAASSRVRIRSTPFTPERISRTPRRILRILEIDIDCSAAAPVMLHVTVAPGGDGFPDRDSFTSADLLEVPAQTFGIHSMVRGGEKRRVGRRLHGLAKEVVHARQVFFRFGRFRSPHVHWIIRGVNVQDANVRASFENVDGRRHQPIINIRAINDGRGAELLDPLGRWGLRGKHNFSAAQKESCCLRLAGKQRRLHPFRAARSNSVGARTRSADST